MAGARIFTIPPGARFLSSFVAALLDGAIIPGLSRKSGPLVLADATIFVPTRRAARGLLTAFSHATIGSAIILPRVRPLGAVDEDAEFLTLPEENADNVWESGIPDAIGEIERRFLLGNLILRWSQALRHAVVRPSSQTLQENEAMLVGATPADALALGRTLAHLIDEFIIERAPWSAVRNLVTDDFDIYWSLTTRFLQIAIADWPKILEERGMIDAADARNRLIEREIFRLSQNTANLAGSQRSGRKQEPGSGPTQGLARDPMQGAMQGPMIVLGSTGTNRATAELMRAIARTPNGAIVLPGLDAAMPQEQWRALTAPDDEAESSYGHPQKTLAQLLARLDVSRENVSELGLLAPAHGARNRFLSQALALPKATADWRHYRNQKEDEIAAAFKDISVIEADDEREEALAIAIRLRAALEQKGATAALATPDRAIARRVQAELERWSIGVDDSGGEPLGVTGAGAFARMVLTAAQSGPSDVALAALLAQSRTAPDIASLPTREKIADCARAFESAVLRATIHNADCEARIDLAAAAAKERYAHPAARRLDEDQWEDIALLAKALREGLAPLAALDGRHPFARWVEAHRLAMGRLSAHADKHAGGEAQENADEADKALEGLMQTLAALDANTAPDILLDNADYSALFDQLVGEVIVRGPRRNHPRLKILGLLEARLLDADLVILAGLDEAIWPPQPKADPFLNRAMRAQLGLPPPERRIGQSAHDFTMAMGADMVVITRAKKRGGAPTVPSRFLQRIAALGGAHYAKAVARGEEWLSLARRIDQPETSRSILRPEPAPPLELRPRSLSLTRIETLWRDPYVIYAERILKLAPLGTLDAAMNLADQGTAIHAVLHELAAQWPSGPLPAHAREKLIVIAQEKLSGFFADPAWRAFRWPDVVAGLDYVLGYEAARRGALSHAVGETAGRLSLTLKDGSEFLLTAVADRIEIETSGAGRIIDFKTGVAPTPNQVKAGFASQLTLAAAMAAQGAFPKIGVLPIESIRYIKLGGAGGGKEINPEKAAPLNDLVADHWASLQDMLNAFRNPARGYPSRPRVQFITRYSDYDHLARVKEWSAGSGGGEE